MVELVIVVSRVLVVSVTDLVIVVTVARVVSVKVTENSVIVVVRGSVLNTV